MPNYPFLAELDFRHYIDGQPTPGVYSTVVSFQVEAVNLQEAETVANSEGSHQLLTSDCLQVCRQELEAYSPDEDFLVEKLLVS